MPLLGTTGTASAKAFNLYGIKSRVTVPLTISSNTYNYDVYTNRGPTYIAGASDITVTVNPGVTVGSTSTPTYALLVPSAFSPLDTVTIINNGVIQGMGGGGGTGGIASTGTRVPANDGLPGAAGGNALYVNRPTTITNNGTVASGGGGGGGGGAFNAPTLSPGNRRAGGGGGGGAGFNGGAGGAIGPNTGPGSLPGVGSPGTSPAGGAGGSSGGTSGVGGTGGGRGAAGAPGGSGTPAPVGGLGGSGGGTGNYIVGNPFVTWPVTGTRQGNVA